jgi:ABC-2 type transport system permease protein
MLILAWKELLELRQNLRLIPLIVVAPLLQLFLLGYAATMDVRDVRLVVADADRTAASRELIARFSASGYFDVRDVVTTVDQIEPWIEQGRARMALSIPPGYGAAVGRRQPVVVQIVADGTDANSTTVAMGYATTLVASYAEELAASPRAATRGTGAPVGPGAVEARVRVWFNPELESRDFMIPGVLALLLLIVTSNLSSMGIVREREVGTLEQLNVTPLRRWELIAGKLLPYAVIGLVDACLVLALAIAWFDVPMRGSLALLLALSVLYVLCTLALGLFVSTISNTQQQALMTTVFFFLVPMVYLSGFIFPIENMPAAIQPFTYLIPLRYYLIVVRGIFLKGIGLEILWSQALAMIAWAAVVLTLAVARLQRRQR